MTELEIKRLAQQYEVKEARMQSVVAALRNVGCAEEQLLNAIDEVMPSVKGGTSPSDAAAAWAEQHKANNAIGGLSDIDLGVNQVQQEDAEDVRYAAEYRATAMRVQYHLQTAHVFLNGPQIPELKALDQHARQSFRDALRGSAKKNYQVGGDFSLTRRMETSLPASATNQGLPSAN